MRFLGFIALILNFILLINVSSVDVSEPIITAWKKNSGTGYGGYLNNVLKIQYSTNYVYITCNDIPDYTIGPWSNPNVPKAQNYTFKFPRNPAPQSGTKTTTGLGHMGLLINGVSLYNTMDGFSYNSLGIWNRNAYYWEGSSFDSCTGHADASGTYHNHANPVCLYTTNTSSTHSPLLGFILDGYPIYGPYGYSSANNSNSGIKRMVTSWRLRSITDRTTLSNGTVLTSNQHGPAINSTYPLGSYIEDYEYVSGLGDLDYYNGRWCVTPEYPNGIYAYFVPTDANLGYAFPYLIGPSYYGVVVSTSGRITVSETVTTYYSYSSARSVYASVFNLIIILILGFIF